MSCKFNEGILEIDSKGIGAHGSLPHLGKNAVSQVLSFLNQLNIENEEIKSYIEFICSKIGFETDGKSLGLNLSDDVSGKLTLNLGVFNLTEEKIETTLNLRVPVTFNPNEVIEKIRLVAQDAGISIEDLEIQKPLHVSKDSFLIKTLQNVYTEKTGMEATPLAIGGGTYAKAFNNIVAFGPIFPGDPDLDHQANEYIEIEKLLLMTKIYANALYELAK
jgi:succinyl-diaminopimelate desuccinylase